MELAEMDITSIDQLDFSKRYTYADYLLWKFEERLELIKGRIFRMSPAPSRRHQEIVGDLYFTIRTIFESVSCQLFVSPFDVRLPEKSGSIKSRNVVQPDLCIVCDATKLDEKGCNGAPDLIIEVLSPGNTKKEMDDKYSLYEESGVREYWMVQPEDKCVIIYVLNEHGQYIGIKPSTDRVKSVIFPQVEFDLEPIWR